VFRTFLGEKRLKFPESTLFGFTLGAFLGEKLLEFPESLLVGFVLCAFSGEKPLKFPESILLCLPFCAQLCKRLVASCAFLGEKPLKFPESTLVDFVLHVLVRNALREKLQLLSVARKLLLTLLASSAKLVAPRVRLLCLVQRVGQLLLERLNE